ncbi:MAG: HEAT repeat domain-containing protein [Pseudomonadota bacterium]
MNDVETERIRRRLAGLDEEDRRRALAEIPEEWAPGILSILVDALGDSSWRVRKDAIARIARWPDPDGAVPMLIATLAEDSNVGLRNAAIEALALIGRPAVGPLATALEAGGPHRKLLIDALGAIGDTAAVPILVRSLDDPDENARAAAAEALANTGGPGTALALRRRLPVGDLLGRLAALEALNKLGVVVPLVELAPLVGQQVLRRATLEAMGRTGDAGALPFLLEGLGDRGRAVREAAVAGLASLHHAREGRKDQTEIESAIAAVSGNVVEILVALVSAESVTVRKAAVEMLGWGRWTEALGRLICCLADEEIRADAIGAIVAYGPKAIAPLVEVGREARPSLKAAIFTALARLGSAGADTRVSSVLIAGLEDESTDAAIAAARALGEIGGRSVLAPLFHALEHAVDSSFAHVAAQAIGKLGTRFYDEVRMLIGARGIEGGPLGVHLCRVLATMGRATDRSLLLGALHSDDSLLRRAAVEAVASLGHAPETRDALVYALTDEDSGVRAAAAYGLGKIQDQEVVQALIGALGDEEQSVRIAALRALGSLGDRRVAPALRDLARAAVGAVAVHAIEALSMLASGQSSASASASDAAADESVFLAAIGNDDAEVVKAAVMALVKTPGERTLDALVAALGHRRWDVRRLAVDGLAQRIGEAARVKEALVARAQVEADPLVREVLAAAVNAAAVAVPATTPAVAVPAAGVPAATSGNDVGERTSIGEGE